MKDKHNRREQAAALRRHAEEITLEREAQAQENIEVLSSEEIRRTMHELRVHQIELETQNEELRRTQVELDTSRARYYDLYDLAPVAYFTLSEKGLILEANLTAATLLGLARSILVNRPLSLFIFSEDQDIFYLHHKQLFKTEMPQVSEIRMLSQDGKTFWVRMESTVAQDIDGASTCRTVVSDITDRKLVEAREIQRNKILEGINRIHHEAITCETEKQIGDICLKVAEELTESKNGFIGEIGPDNQMCDITISNPGWKDCTIIGKTGHRRTPGRFKIHGLHGRVLKDGKSLLVNNPAVHPDSIGLPEGHPPLTAFLGAPMILDGKTIGLIAVGNRDGGYEPEHQYILESLAPTVLQVLLKKRADVKLQTSETRFRAFFENDAVGTAELSLEGRFLQVNSCLCQMTGCSAEELLGMTPHDLSLPEDAQHNRKFWNIYLQGKNMPVLDRVCRFRRKSGNIIWVQVSAAMIRDARGRPLRLACVLIDFSERKQMDEALNEQTMKLEASNKELESFSYSVSHDLRAPLRAIDGYSRMILKQQRDKLDENAKRQFDVIRDKTQRMGQLIDDLLAFSRLGGSEVSMSRLNMEDLARGVWEELKAINPDRHMDLKINSMPAGMGDRSLIKQVLTNLLSNAIKFSKIREISLIEMGAYAEKDENVYYVRDNGVGFDMKYYDKLFGVFQRLHADTEYEGTGIGLALVKRIVNRHGGRIWAEGEVDKGATFYFTLPTRKK